MKGIEWRIFFRSFLIQGGWNYRTLLGAGFAWVLLVLPRQKRSQSAENEWIVRHSVPFNSHPYLASAVLGAVAKLEVEGRPAAEVRRFKDALGSLFGSLGDGLIWNGWRPVTLLFAMAMALLGYSPTSVVLVFLLLYNALHLWMRFSGVRMGIAKGIQIGDGVRELNFPLRAERIRTVGVLLLGLISGILFVQGGRLSALGWLISLGGGGALLLGWVLGESIHRWIPAVFLLVILCGLLPIMG